ncbi:DNA repair protein complementing XP-G cells homolog isoform X2 [Myzus persicae]|uniref:DNA repair protein complementing XP-G cells homolog isoform X2 n=1 Tax=Myzus persicae TaxID=13164 RepID=UPI000B93A0E7|nr:DNA repair protein complementing XP-G cells homolog isoform X2 [Myzus persicae]
MGVQGLWKLLESAGKPIPVEKLENKVLSIDVSIWLYQIIKGVQENEHGATTNGHLIVMFHRICKLLFYGIKPIFVFDGGVPELKKITIAQRQAQKNRAKKSTGKTKEKLLKNMLEQAALKTVMNAQNALTEDEVISKTVSSLNKGAEIDLFELPKLAEPIEIEKTKIPIKEKDRTYLNLSKEKNENILLLAVENQNHDCLYANIAKDKETSSPKKLNAFSSMQIGDLLNGFSEDQKKRTEKKNQQKSKHEMTLNELEMFLNNDSGTINNIDEFSQNIDSDHDTVFYYESGINKSAKTSNSENIEMPKKTKTSNVEKSFKTESKNTSQKIFTTDTIGSPTLTEDIDEDIFKALAGDESLEEDRLAWLIFNENKIASKRRSSFSSSSEVLTSDMEEDVTIKNNKVPTKKYSSRSIFITEDNVSNENVDNFNEEDYLSWVSHTKDEPSQTKLENKDPIINHQDIPSTSKSSSFLGNENNVSNKKNNIVDQQNINESIYFASESMKTQEFNMFSNVSSSIESDNSNGSFSENSVNFSPEESLSEDDNIILQENQNKQKVNQSFKKESDIPIVAKNEFKEMNSTKKVVDNQNKQKVNQSSKKESDVPIVAKNEFKGINSTKNVIREKFNSPTKLNKISTKRPEPDNPTSSMNEQYYQSIQDTLVKRQNDLASLQRTSDRMASSVTQKITSEIKGLLKLFGIPYITAPMEAEAQCVFLEKMGRTEGTVTDDSDVWLFGANVVYKDFFDSQKYVKQFKSIDIKQQFALSRNSFIQLAFLVGSDYTNGIDGIGPVSAIEILSFFETETKNMGLEEKLLKIKEIANSKAEVYCDIPFIKKLKSTKIGNDFPNKAVINAYLHPIVNDSNQSFSWGTPQIDSIVEFAQTNFDWDVSKTKSKLAPVLKKVSERTTQTTLDSFVKTLPQLSSTNTAMSKRVSQAVKRLRNDTSSVESNKKSGSSKISFTDSNDITDKKRRRNLK